jgi:microcystin-dependent protein
MRRAQHDACCGLHGAWLFDVAMRRTQHDACCGLHGAGAAVVGRPVVDGGRALGRRAAGADHDARAAAAAVAVGAGHHVHVARRARGARPPHRGGFGTAPSNVPARFAALGGDGALARIRLTIAPQPAHEHPYRTQPSCPAGTRRRVHHGAAQSQRKILSKSWEKVTTAKDPLNSAFLDGGATPHRRLQPGVARLYGPMRVCVTCHADSPA